jgi:alpha-amylase
MKSLCFYFQVHQPFRLKTYRFFNIGHDHHYFDDYQNRFIAKRVADKCYLPMNQLLLDLIKEYGSAFKVSFSISGTALDTFEKYAPEVLESFARLAKTGSVEFLAETYGHSLSSLKSREEFEKQVKMQSDRIKKLFGYTPTTFRNTELIYSDEIGAMVADMGYGTMLAEGAKHVLGWKSPNYMYCNAINPKLKLLLKNFQLSDDIAFRFSQQSWDGWPLTTEKFVDWLNALDAREEVVNLFMDYETFGEHQWPETGIFDFMRALPARIFSHSSYQFATPKELSEKLQPVGAIHVPYPISWADEERDLTAWLGNELQDEAFDKLYQVEQKIKHCDDKDLQRDWILMQTSDHFYYMCTKWFSDGDVHKYFNPYGSPYEAFINYMNVLSDFINRIEGKCGKSQIAQIAEKQAEVAGDVSRMVREKSKEATVKVKKALKDVKSKSHEFSDIAAFSNAKIKKLLNELETTEVFMALQGASHEVRTRVIDNLSATARKQYEKLEKEAKKVKKTDVKEIRTKIEKLINKTFQGK